MIQKQINDSAERSYRLSNSFLFLNYMSHMSGEKKGDKQESKQKSR